MKKLLIIVGLFLMLLSPFVNADEVIDLPTIGTHNTTLATIELIKNTDSCLVDCEAILKVSPKTTFVGTKNDFFTDFVKKSIDVPNLIDWGYFVGIEKTIQVSVPVYELVDYNALYLQDANAIKQSCLQRGLLEFDSKYCYKVLQRKVVKGYKNESRTVIDWTDLKQDLSKLVVSDLDTRYLRLWGKKDPKLRESSIDWQLTFNGEKIAKWAWWNGSWTKKQKVTMNTDGIGLTGDITNDFVILVSISADNISFWAGTQANGEDVRFTNAAEDTELKYHFEHFDHTADEMRAWVGVTDTFTSAAPTEAYVYYGSAGAADGQDEAGTYSSIYESVYHLSGNVLDSLGNNDLNIQGGITPSTGGKIYHAYDFDGSAGSFLDNNVFDGSENVRTIQMWISPDAIASSQVIWSLTYDGSNRFYTYGLAGTKLNFRLYLPSAQHFGINTVDAVTLGSYSLLSQTCGTGGAKLWINQALKSSDANASVPNSIMDDWKVGADPWNAFYNGKMDEIRVFNITINNNDVNLLYNSDTNNLLSFGAEEAGNVNPDVNVIEPNGNQYVDGNYSIDFNVQDLDNPQTLYARVYYSATAELYSNIIADVNLNDHAALGSVTCDDTTWTNSTKCLVYWDTTAVPVGDYFIDINVSDTDLNGTDSSNASFRVNQEPTIVVNAPSDLGWISGIYSIDFNVSDLDDTDDLWIYLYYSATAQLYSNLVLDANLNDYAGIAGLTCDDSDWTNSTNCTYSWDTTSIADANYFIDANTADQDYNVTDSSNFNFAIDNNAVFSDFNLFWYSAEAVYQTADLNILSDMNVVFDWNIEWHFGYNIRNVYTTVDAANDDQNCYSFLRENKNCGYQKKSSADVAWNLIESFEDTNHFRTDSRLPCVYRKRATNYSAVKLADANSTFVLNNPNDWIKILHTAEQSEVDVNVFVEYCFLANYTGTGSRTMHLYDCNSEVADPTTSNNCLIYSFDSATPLCPCGTLSYKYITNDQNQMVGDKNVNLTDSDFNHYIYYNCPSCNVAKYWTLEGIDQNANIDRERIWTTNAGGLAGLIANGSFIPSTRYSWQNQNYATYLTWFVGIDDQNSVPYQRELITAGLNLTPIVHDINAPDANSWNSGTIDVYGIVSDSENNTIVCDFNLVNLNLIPVSTLAYGVAVTNGICGTTFDTTAVVDGNYYIELRVRETGTPELLDSNAYSDRFFVDNSAPVLNTYSPLVNVTQSSDTAVFNASYDDVNSGLDYCWIELYYNGAFVSDVNTASCSTTIAIPLAGDYAYVIIRGVDVAGNISAGTTTGTITRITTVSGEGGGGGGGVSFSLDPVISIAENPFDDANNTFVLECSSNVLFIGASPTSINCKITNKASFNMQYAIAFDENIAEFIYLDTKFPFVLEPNTFAEFNLFARTTDVNFLDEFYDGHLVGSFKLSGIYSSYSLQVDQIVNVVSVSKISPLEKVTIGFWGLFGIELLGQPMWIIAVAFLIMVGIVIGVYKFVIKRD